jgi:ubiquinone/menaquinone biosynthesis C-methylase UbiE
MTEQVESKTEPLYDSKWSSAYGYFEKQNFHEDGPYLKITDIVVERAKIASSIPVVVLDLASGTGEPAATIAMKLPDATVISTDCSEAMHSMAKKRVEEISNLQAAMLDMQDLTPLYDNNTIDFVTCSLGIIFAKNKTKAVEEAFRVLKSGGTYINTFFTQIPHYDLFRALVDHVTDGKHQSPPSFDPMIFSEPGSFEKILKDAGFTDIQTIESKYPLEFSNDPEFFLNSMYSFDFNKIFESVPNGKEKVKEILPELTPKYMHIKEDGTFVSLNCVFKCVSARKP